MHKSAMQAAGEGRRQILCVRSGYIPLHAVRAAFPSFSSTRAHKLAPCSFETLMKRTPGVSADAFNRFKLEIFRIFAKVLK